MHFITEDDLNRILTRLYDKESRVASYSIASALRINAIILRIQGALDAPRRFVPVYPVSVYFSR
jgi:hypothetical protein